MPLDHIRSRFYWYHNDHGLIPRGESLIPNHVQFVREHDALFGLPAGYVDETFKMHGEPNGTEGRAQRPCTARVFLMPLNGDAQEIFAEDNRHPWPTLVRV